MGVEMKWGDARCRYIVFSFTEPWEWQELHLTIVEFIAALPADYTPVPILVDLHGMHHIPPNAFTHSRLLVKYTADAPLGKVLIMGANNLMRIFHSILLGLGNKIAQQVIFFDTPEQAREYLQALIEKQDASRPPPTNTGR